MEPYRRIALAALLAASLLVLGACSTKGHGQDRAGSESQSAAPPSGQPQTAEKVTNVSVHTVALENLEETFALPGTLEAWEDLTLAAEVAGPVRWVGPAEGDRVATGESILRIDPETLQADLARREAELASRTKHRERMEKLAERQLVSQQELDDAVQAHEVARAELTVARVALEKSTLTSPVDGILDRLLVDRGEYVSPGTPAAVVVQVDRLNVLVEVPEKDVPTLRAGQTVRVAPTAGAPEGASRRAELIHLAYKADPETRTYRAKFTVANPDLRLRPGMIVRVEIPRRALRQVIAVPLYAVVDRDGRKVVFVEVDGVAQQRTVTTGAIVGEKVVILGGLRAGERLLVRGQQLVGDGARVTVVTEAGPAGGEG